MQRIRSLALPAAICMAIAGACHDAPLAPRPPATDGLAPNAILTSDGSTMPQILSHYEKLSFGWHTASSSVPSAVNAEMTFIGDDGEIDLANVTVTPDSGAPFTNSAQMALGPGQIVNCADVTLGSCNNHHLSGVASLSGAPDCNARASGTIAYWAAVIRSSAGFSWGPISQYTGSGLTTTSSSAPFTATAPRCATTQQQGTSTGGTSGDSSSTSGTGTVGPPPPPTGPNVPVAPPPYSPPPTGGGFVCQQTDVYQIIGTTRTLFSSVIDCYHED